MHVFGIVECYPTLQSIRGFLSTVDHLDQAHPEGFPEGSGSGCILCGKAFGRRDHLKNHLFYHVAKIRYAPIQHRSYWTFESDWIGFFLSKPQGVGLTYAVKTGKAASKRRNKEMRHCCDSLANSSHLLEAELSYYSM